jgi:AraC-like DNA-binding protein
VRNWAEYRTPSEAHRALGLVCLGVGEQRARRGQARGRVLDCYAAVVVTQGAGQLLIEGQSQTVRVPAPTIFWLRPGVRHSYGPEASGWAESWLLFDGPAARGYEDLGFIPAGRPSVALEDPLPLAHVLRRLGQVCRADAGDADVQAAALVHEFVVTAKTAAQRRSGQPDEDIVAAVRASALSDMSVAARAKAAGLSVRQLREAVQRAAGCSPTEFVQQVRVNRAKTLLVDSEASVTQIARQVGFGDPAYFTRLFRQRVGSSPRDFRREQREFLR